MTSKNALRTVAGYNALGELLEISTAALLAICIFLSRDAFLVSLTVTLFLASVATRLREEALQSREEKKLQEQTHVITPQRLKTLGAVNVGMDVLDVLHPLVGQEPLSTGSLISKLEDQLGQERAQEKLSDVLRYTRVTGAKPRQ